MVFDKTELNGNFRVAPLVRASGMNIPLGALGGTPGTASDPSRSGSVSSSVKQLGLNPEPQKAPTEFLVVDHVEKMPTEN